MFTFDVRNYYGSIVPERALGEAELVGLKPADRTELETLLVALRAYGVRGLPIGPDASAVLGTWYLHALDEKFTANGWEYTRFTDDIRVFASKEVSGDQVREELSALLRSLGLVLADEKTRFLSRREAFAELSHPTIASFEATFARRATDANELHEAFDRLAATPPHLIHPSVFRWMVRTLRNISDAYAVHELLASEELIRIDPVDVGEYLVVVRTPETTSRVLAFLAGGVSEPAVALHLIRSLIGVAEAVAPLLNIARTSDAHPMIRAQAIRSLAPTDAAIRTACELADDADSPYPVRRSAVALLRGARAKSARCLLRAIAADRTPLAITAEWALAG